MIDFLLYYSFGGVAWCVWIEILQRKGFIAKAGFIIFFPFVATTLLGEMIRGK